MQIGATDAIFEPADARPSRRALGPERDAAAAAFAAAFAALNGEAAAGDPAAGTPAEGPDAAADAVAGARGASNGGESPASDQPVRRCRTGADAPDATVAAPPWTLAAGPDPVGKTAAAADDVIPGPAAAVAEGAEFPATPPANLRLPPSGPAPQATDAAVAARPVLADPVLAAGPDPAAQTGAGIVPGAVPVAAPADPASVRLDAPFAALLGGPDGGRVVPLAAAPGSGADSPLSQNRAPVPDAPAVRRPDPAPTPPRLVAAPPPPPAMPPAVDQILTAQAGTPVAVSLVSPRSAVPQASPPPVTAYPSAGAAADLQPIRAEVTAGPGPDTGTAGAPSGGSGAAPAGRPPETAAAVLQVPPAPVPRPIPVPAAGGSVSRPPTAGAADSGRDPRRPSAPAADAAPPPTGQERAPAQLSPAATEAPVLHGRGDSFSPPAAGNAGGTQHDTRPVHRHDTAPQPVLAQVAEAARRLPDGTVEVRLSPEELGRVRLSLAPGDSGLVVHLVAERPETLDLMRRHVDLLAGDLRQQGFAGLSFSFGRDNGTGGQTHRVPRGRDDDPATAPAAAPPPPRAAVRRQKDPDPAGRIDLRL